MRLVDRHFQSASISKRRGNAFIPALEVINQGTDGFHLGGNLDVDPDLAGFALMPGSPLVDAGTCAGAPPFDIEGDPRPSGAACDIGADELVP